MSSSKFSSPKKWYKRPAVCKTHKTPLSSAWDSLYPPQLSVDFRVMDFDPPVNYRFFGSFLMHRSLTDFTYKGSSPKNALYVACVAAPIDFAGKWHFDFTVVAPFLPFEHFIYAPVIPLDKNALDSRNMGEVRIPNQDERYFRVYG